MNPSAARGAVALRLIDPAAARAIIRGECPPGQRCAPGFPTEGDRIAATLYLERCAAGADPGPFGAFLVCLRDPSSTVIGGIGFHGGPDERGRVEVGYGIVPAQQGKGYATAALRLLMARARELGVRVLLAETDICHSASQAVLRRCGFTVAGEDQHTGYFECPLT